jgi:type IX secretion system PorP/SprF family membrane protein
LKSYYLQTGNDSLMRLFKILFLIFSAIQAFGQQTVQYSMYMLNPYHYNTAYSGLDESLSLTVVFRKQWTGFNGSPIGGNFNVHLPIEYLNSGFGLAIEFDKIGAYENLQGKFSYNYIIDLNTNYKLSLGGAFRYLQRSVNGELLRAPDGDYENGAILSHNDNLIPFSKVSSNAFTCDAGIYLKSNNLDLGMAIQHLTNPTIKLDANVFMQQFFIRNFIFNFSYLIEINELFSLKPTLLLKTDFIKVQPELGIIFDYRNNIFGGISLRGYDEKSLDAFMIMAGLKIANKFTLAYAYDIGISGLNNFHSGSHEIILNYNLREPIGKELPSKVIYNPRFF